MRSSANCMAACTVVLLAQLALGAEPNWPRFRGPHGSGVSSSESLPPLKFGQAENVLWKTPLPSGVSSPCIWGSQIFLTGFTPGSKQQQGTLEAICVNRHNGEILWRRAVPAKRIEKVHRVSSPANATPVTDGERVYFYFASAGLFCYDTAGMELWSVSLPVPETRFGSGTSPILAKEIVLLNRDVPTKPSLLAFDRRTGEQVWERPHPPMIFGPQTANPEGYATPVVWRDEVVVHRPGEISGYAIHDGARRWRVQVATSGESSPVVTADAIYVSAWTNGGEPDLRVPMPSFEQLVRNHDENGDRQLTKQEFPADLVGVRRPEALNEQGGEVPVIQFFDMIDGFRADQKPGEKDGHIDQKEWTVVLGLVETMQQDHGLLAIRPEGSGDLTDENIVWRENQAVAEVPSVLNHAGRVYMIKNGGILTCIDAQSGERLYRKRVGATGSYYASPVASGNRVYVTSSSGVVTVLATGEQFKVLSQNDLGEDVKATPAIVDGTLYVRAASHLYAFGSR